MSLTGKQRRYLRGLANPLKAQVTIGAKGVFPNIVDEISALLLSNELLKVRVNQAATAAFDKKELAQQVAEKCKAELVQIVGKSIVIYRENPENKKIKLP